MSGVMVLPINTPTGLQESQMTLLRPIMAERIACIIENIVVGESNGMIRIVIKPIILYAKLLCEDKMI